ncbi:unnamed protein product [Enterobius vermicularis]|uniref:Apple domain-containing protein n=1 Tax=Enterobius vermicularis TaxID=51028 RepID=A0A0N4VFH7_ENTVE|nr:unnamed protein product [Enterobius vermicularis]
MNILRFFLTFTRLLGVTYGTVKVNFIALNMTKLTLFCSADIENATSEKECAAACLNEDNDCSAFQFNETYCTCWKYGGIGKRVSEATKVCKEMNASLPIIDTDRKAKTVVKFLKGVSSAHPLFRVAEPLSVSKCRDFLTHPAANVIVLNFMKSCLQAVPDGTFVVLVCEKRCDKMNF